MSDSLAEMKVRVRYKHLTYPYLYDGDAQQATRAYGPKATPHIFIFDQQRHLRYEGRIDTSYRTELVKTHEARDAIDALLAHKEIAVTHTGVFGCSTKWAEKSSDKAAALEKIDQQSVNVTLASKSDIAKLAHESVTPDDADRLLGNLVRKAASPSLPTCKIPCACTRTATSRW